MRKVAALLVLALLLGQMPCLGLMAGALGCTEPCCMSAANTDVDDVAAVSDASAGGTATCDAGCMSPTGPIVTASTAIAVGAVYDRPPAVFIDGRSVAPDPTPPRSFRRV